MTLFLRRLFVGAFLGVFGLVGVGEVNRWPFTNWRLFSTVRGPAQDGWEVAVVRPDGSESGLPTARLPKGYGATLHVLFRFPRMTEAERDELCRTWRDAVEDLGDGDGDGGDGDDIGGVRIYRTRSTVSLGGRPTPTTTLHRQLVHQC